MYDRIDMYCHVNHVNDRVIVHIRARDGLHSNCTVLQVASAILSVVSEGCKSIMEDDDAIANDLPGSSVKSKRQEEKSKSKRMKGKL